MARFDSILAAVQKTKPGDSLVGHKTQSAALCKVLEEVSTLYSWDRPALHSLVKKGRNGEQKLGNAVVVVTRLPEDMKELNRFLGTGDRNKKPTVREVVETIRSKKIKSQFSGELNIALHIVDTGEGIGGERREVAQLLNKALKEMRGGVIPLSSLSKLFGTIVDSDSQCSTLLCSSRSIQSMSSSAAVRAHLAEVSMSSKKVLDKKFMQEQVKVGERVLGVEFVTCGLKLSELESRGLIGNTFFKPGHKWKESFSVWSDNSPELSSVSLYLQHSGQCLVMENKDNIMAVMYYQTESSAFFCIMDRVESHFYHMLLSLDSHIPTITLNEEINILVTNIKNFQFSPCMKPVFTPQPVTAQFDMSILESWRLPDIPASQVMISLKAAMASLSGTKSSYHKLMLGVRESYTGSGVIKEDKMQFDNESRVITKSSKSDVTAGKLGKKLSTMSTSSTVGIGSSGARDMSEAKGGRLNLSRGEILRQLGERNRSLVDETGDGKSEEIDSSIFGKETVLGSKTRAAADLVLKMVDSNRETDVLIDNFAALKNSVVTGTDDLVLAGYAEACISVLLKHLDMVNMCKTSLEEVVTSKLLLDVSTVSKLSSANPTLRVAQHKVEVLLRIEVHWLLANQSKQEQYENSILTHLRQISLHGGNIVMTEFLSVILTECYADRQPELLSFLYNELDQEQPRQLAMMFNPAGSQPPSARPSSNFVSTACGSQGAMAPPPVITKPASKKSNSLCRSFRAWPMSFGTSLTRQINIGAGKMERKNLKVASTGNMITKSKLSSRKRNPLTKSPKKTKQMLERNLTFDDVRPRSSVFPLKSPRKNLSVTTPSKVRRKASFYPEVGSINVQKFEDSFNASLITGNISSLDMNSSSLGQSCTRRDSTDGIEPASNRSFMTFPHLINKKREREDSLYGDELQGLNSSTAEFHARTKVAGIDVMSPVEKVQSRLNSFSEPSSPSIAAMCKPSSLETVNSQAFLKPLQSNCLSGTVHLGLQHMTEQDLEYERMIQEGEEKLRVENEMILNDKIISGETCEGTLEKFSHFHLKHNMKLAPIVRNDPELAKKRIDSLDMPAGPDGLYLALLKTDYTVGKQTKTCLSERWCSMNDVIETPENDEDCDKITMRRTVAQVPRAKLLQFHDDHGLSFWGTWTKKSEFISGR